MYQFGQTLLEDLHFQDHMEHGVAVQVYLDKLHVDIGYVHWLSEDFVKINNLYYNRKEYTFVSRPGY